MPSTMRLIAELHAAAHSIDVVRRVRHRLLTAGDDRPARSPALIDCAASITALRPEPQTLLIVSADTVAGMPDLMRRLTRRRLADAALDDVAHDHFFDRLRVDAGALDRGANGDRAELRRGERREAAEELADRRAGSRNDDGLPRCIRHVDRSSEAEKNRLLRHSDRRCEAPEGVAWDCPSRHSDRRCEAPEGGAIDYTASKAKDTVLATRPLCPLRG